MHEFRGDYIPIATAASGGKVCKLEITSRFGVYDESSKLAFIWLAVIRWSASKFNNSAGERVVEGSVSFGQEELEPEIRWAVDSCACG